MDSVPKKSCVPILCPGKALPGDGWESSKEVWLKLGEFKREEEEGVIGMGTDICRGWGGNL